MEEKQRPPWERGVGKRENSVGETQVVSSPISLVHKPRRRRAICCAAGCRRRALSDGHCARLRRHRTSCVAGRRRSLRSRQRSSRSHAPPSHSLEEAAVRTPPHWLVPAGGARHGSSHVPRLAPAEGARRLGYAHAKEARLCPSHWSIPPEKLTALALRLRKELPLSHRLARARRRGSLHPAGSCPSKGLTPLAVVGPRPCHACAGRQEVSPATVTRRPPCCPWC